MSEQGTAAAERSAHVIRGEVAPERPPARCCHCGGPFRGGASAAARVLLPGPGLVQVCSEACRQAAGWAVTG